MNTAISSISEGGVNVNDYNVKEKSIDYSFSSSLTYASEEPAFLGKESKKKSGQYYSNTNMNSNKVSYVRKLHLNEGDLVNPEFGLSESSNVDSWNIEQLETIASESGNLQEFMDIFNEADVSATSPFMTGGADSESESEEEKEESTPVVMEDSPDSDSEEKKEEHSPDTSEADGMTAAMNMDDSSDEKDHSKGEHKKGDSKEGEDGFSATSSVPVRAWNDSATSFGGFSEAAPNMQYNQFNNKIMDMLPEGFEGALPDHLQMAMGNPGAMMPGPGMNMGAQMSMAAQQPMHPMGAMGPMGMGAMGMGAMGMGGYQGETIKNTPMASAFGAQPGIQVPMGASQGGPMDAAAMMKQGQMNPQGFF